MFRVHRLITNIGTALLVRAVVVAIGRWRLTKEMATSGTAPHHTVTLLCVLWVSVFPVRLREPFILDALDRKKRR